jgi:uncharacterized protein (TIGR02145 family)
MKYITTSFLLAAFAVCVQAQTVADYQPDANGDGCIGSADIIGLLTLYGTGDCPQFTCGQPLSYQGYDYATVQIGEQCWFAENLRSENYQNGDIIVSGLTASELCNTAFGAFTTYGEDGDINCQADAPNGDACDDEWSLSQYGRLYNWNFVQDSRGACPSGWHVPSDEDWIILEIELGLNAEDAISTGWRGVHGFELKETYGWRNDANGSNGSGFSGLPGGGFVDDCTSFYAAGVGGFWWTSSVGNNFNAWSRSLTEYSNQVGRDETDVASCLSVRCVRNPE